MLRNRGTIRLIKNIRRYYTTVDSNPVKQKSDEIIAKHLYSKIQATGPITVAEYMKQVLIHPMGGYYMHKDVFGETGDFITSPELGQIFGEMIAIWLLNEWSKIGSPKPLQIVELGPGRGSLSQDLLRVFKYFDALKETSLHLVEISDLMSDLQARKLCVNTTGVKDDSSMFYKEGTSFQGIPVKWYRNLKDVPQGFTLFVAHEFFDALPIHKFQKTESGFREILVDIDTTKDLSFRFIIAREETPASKLFVAPNEKRSHIEICPEALLHVKDISGRLEEHGGVALIADYGHNGEGEDTFRAFKSHKLHDPLEQPGSADLTADVDFALINKIVGDEKKVISFGPITQRAFLLNLGIEYRVKNLEEGASEEERSLLKEGFHMMTDADKMGTRFKFLALFPCVLESILKKIPPAGFQ